ncbi:MAG: hypothetical protein J6S21_06450, partial [Victivallales bacterium]|nr:hypothetical protein [Victivallales bacterium]
MKLCAIQIPFAYSQAEADASVDFLISQLKSCDADCDLILTPEYSNGPATFEKGACIPYTVSRNDELISVARETAKRCNAIVAVNHVREAEPGLFRNTTTVFGRDGEEAGCFYKQHLPRAEANVNLLDESYTFEFRAPEIVEVDGIRLGFLICYDTYFTEYICHLAYRHPDIVLVSSFQRGERQDVLRMQNRNIAFTCNSYVLRASVSMGENAEVGGCSLAATPEGDIIDDFGSKCGIFTAEIADPKHKLMRSNSFGGAMIPNDRFLTQGRTPWAYRTCGSPVIPGDHQVPYPRVCAHRGFNTVLPENTMPAFGAAIALGAPEIELDVRFSKDRVAMVCHDPTLDHTSNGTGQLSDYTLEELRNFDFGIKAGEHFGGMKIPTFEEVLSQFSRQAIINLHIKSDESSHDAEFPDWQMEQIVELLERYDMLDHVYFMGAPDVMRSAIKHAPDIPRCIGAFPDPWDIVERGIKYG